MATVCILQHIAIETPGLIAAALQAAGCRTEAVLSHTGQPVPATMAGYDGLVVMGGPQSVYEQDQFPFLRDELHQAGVDARAILAGAKKHLPPLQMLGADVFAWWALA